MPDNLQSISCSLRAKVQNLSQGKKADVSDSSGFALNGIDRSAAVLDLHLTHAAGKYFLDALGKTGEAKADRGVNITLKHQAFKEEVHVSLRHRRGRAHHAGRARRHRLDRGRRRQRRHAAMGDAPQRSQLSDDRRRVAAGEAIYIPYMGKAAKASAESFSLLELRGPTFVADCLDKLKIEDGFVVIEGLAGGDYDLFIKDTQTHITLRVAAGPSELGYAMGGYRHVELTNPRPLQIVSAQADNDTLTIQLANAGKNARVHLAATRYMPEYSMFAMLFKASEEPTIALHWSPQSFYVSGRNIGDEYRYILDRKYAKIFPGNMLDRPGLLLNPWAIRKTETAQQEPQAGEAIEHKAGEGSGGSGHGPRSEFYGSGGKGVENSANLDYLSQPSVLLAGLTPDEKGVVTVKLADLGRTSSFTSWPSMTATWPSAN